MPPTIRLVSFDAFQTILTPRLPVYVQYSQTFAPFLGVLEPENIKTSFKTALKQLQAEKPAYQADGGFPGWWYEVIKRTAIGAGGDPQVVSTSLPEIVPRLLTRFSSSEGYKLFDDTLPVLGQLKKMNVRTALVSNTDSRMHAVLQDLSLSPYLDPVILSDEVGIEKPSRDIFLQACLETRHNATVTPGQCVHVGDELDCDYHGARAAGMHALLLRRPGPESETEEVEDMTNVEVINGLQNVVQWVASRNSTY